MSRLPDEPGYQARPTALMRSSESLSIIGMEELVEENVVSEMGILVHLL
jgi:hypothetical protein